MYIENLTAEGKNAVLKKVDDIDFVMNHLTLAVKPRQTNEDTRIITRRFLNLDVYMKVNFAGLSESDVSLIVTTDFLNLLGSDAERFWHQALTNMKGKFSIKNLSDMLGCTEFSSDLFVLTTETGADGAVGILYEQIFERFCCEIQCDECYILPSSRHELLLVPIIGGVHRHALDLAQMVQDINESVVEEDIRLAPVVYRYSLRDHAVTIAAEA